MQTAPGQYVWRTPHGLYLMVDHTGTHRLPDRIGDRIHGITQPRTPPPDQTGERRAIIRPAAP